MPGVQIRDEVGDDIQRLVTGRIVHAEALQEQQCSEGVRLSLGLTSYSVSPLRLEPGVVEALDRVPAGSHAGHPRPVACAPAWLSAHLPPAPCWSSRLGCSSGAGARPRETHAWRSDTTASTISHMASTKIARSSGASSQSPTSTKSIRLTISAHVVMTSRNASGTSTTTGLRRFRVTHTAMTASARPAVRWVVGPTNFHRARHGGAPGRIPLV